MMTYLIYYNYLIIIIMNNDDKFVDNIELIRLSEKVCN